MPQENRLQRKSSTVLVASQHQPNVTSRPSRQRHGSNQGHPPPCLQRMGELGTAPPCAAHPPWRSQSRAAAPIELWGTTGNSHGAGRPRAAEVQHTQPWPRPAPGASSSPGPGPGLPATGKVWGEASPGSQSPPRAAASPAFPPRLQTPAKSYVTNQVIQDSQPTLLAKPLTLLIMFPITNLQSNSIDLAPPLQITKK